MSTYCDGRLWVAGGGGAPSAHAPTHQPGGSDAMAVDAVAGTGSLRTLGTGATQSCGGTDARLSDARTPTSHKVSHEPGGGDALAVDAVAGTGSLRTLGSGATSACAGNDSRLSDARTPTSHKASHAKGGGDQLDLQNLGSGAAALGKLFAADGAGGISLVDPTGLPTGIGFTSEGGRYVTMTNKTGVASVKGSVVAPSSTTAGAFQLSASPYYDPIGIVYEAGVADGSPCKVVIDGIADVLVKDGTGSTLKNWVGPSDVSGRADASSVSPPGGTIAALENHFKEIGHAQETKASGTDVLVRCMIHFC